MLPILRNWGRRGGCGLAALLVVFLSLKPVHAQPAETDAAVVPALRLLDEALAPQPSALQNVLMRALRHLEDPRLAPLFEHLIQTDNAMLKVHGQLGLAETRPDHGIDNAAVASVTDPMLQGELISTAFEAGLLPDDQARNLLEWRGLDSGVRLMLAMLMVRDGKLNDPALITGLAEPDSQAQVYLEAALRIQLGQGDAMAMLHELNESASPDRDRIRTMLLEAALRNRLGKLAGWAGDVAREHSGDRRLRLLALEAALRLGDPGAAGDWQQQFASSSDAAQRMRLAMIALDHAPSLQPSFFEPMLTDSNELIRQVGRAGQAVARGSAASDHELHQVDQALVSAVTALALGEHPRTAMWAISYARDHASHADATAILTNVVASFKTEPRQSLTRRLDQTMVATQFLAEHDPQAVAQVVGPIFDERNLNPLRGEAILAGLLKAQSRNLDATAQQLPLAGNPRLVGLVAVLRARHAQDLKAEELSQLGLVVQGVGDLPSAFRIQAAWLYLNARGLSDDVLEKLTRPDPGH